MEPCVRPNSSAPPGRTRLLEKSGGSRSRTRFTTEVEEGNSGGRWVGEQANFRGASGTQRAQRSSLCRRLISMSHASGLPPPPEPVPMAGGQPHSPSFSRTRTSTIRPTQVETQPRAGPRPPHLAMSRGDLRPRIPRTSPDYWPIGLSKNQRPCPGEIRVDLRIKSPSPPPHRSTPPAPPSRPRVSAPSTSCPASAHPAKSAWP